MVYCGHIATIGNITARLGGVYIGSIKCRLALYVAVLWRR
jgi:hypothetical protein